MEIVTIANVSGFIAVAIVVTQFLIPNLLVIILSSTLGSSNTAVTWSVAGRVLHNSHWPTILRTDAATGTGVKRSVQAISWAKTLAVVLISVAGIVTPLGLYEDVVTTGSRTASFIYASDTGPFGYARLPRSNLGFNRRCGNSLPILCPGINDRYERVDNPNGTITVTMDSWDGRIPQSRYEYFESGLSRNSSTISSFWDIEWRNYNYQQDLTQNLPYMNTSKYIIGVYQNFDSLVLRDGIQLIDGLIVNPQTGALGFRNHTVPANINNSAAWSEDLLFVEPESVCVANNLTLEFTVGSFSDVHNFSEVRLIDNGGFANLNRDFKVRVNGTDAQDNLNLTNRAYIAATLNNLLTAAYYNLTDLNATRMDSAVGDSYEVGFTSSTPIYWDRMHTSQTFSDFLELTYAEESAGWNYSSLTSTQSNPWNITSSDFQSILSWCGWFEEQNPGNISTVAVGCDMAFSVARPVSNVSGDASQGPFGIVRAPDSKWAVDLYSCATAVKADIKTVAFSLNGTALQDVSVTSIDDKVYESPAEVPWWGVESTHLRLDSTFPIWGLIDPNLPQLPNVSTTQKEALYLPGLIGNSTEGAFSFENLPGADFATPFLALLAFIGGDDSTDVAPSIRPIDYSGLQSVAMLQKWSQLSKTAEGMANIHQIIWGDMAASALVGTKGLAGRSPERQLRLTKRDDSEAPPSLPNTQTITLSTRRVLYHWPFAIPAFLVALTLILISLSALISCCVNRSPYRSLCTALERTSAGRLLAAAVYPHSAAPGIGTKEWVSLVGRREVTFHQGYPTGPRQEQEAHLASGHDYYMGNEKQPGASYTPVSGSE